jgi:hypothetical protein
MTPLEATLGEALVGLYALVIGEAASLLEEDRGGSAHQAEEIEKALALYREAKDRESTPSVDKS